MSDEIATQSAEPVEGSTTPDSVITEAPDTPTLDVLEYSNHRVPVKLDGEELQIPLSEAIAGYQRQADYTRKTQELSEQREQVQFASTLQAALENNPAATLSLLSQHYNVSNTPEVDAVDEESFTPEERKIRELDKRVASFEDFQNQQQIEKEISGLQNKYGDFDVKEVVSSALRMNTTDLEGVYKQLSFDKIVAQSKIELAAKERLKQADNSVLEAKRAASVVAGGSSAASSTTTEKVAPAKSIAEAWAAAKHQLGAN
jgi:hypothetical protein